LDTSYQLAHVRQYGKHAKGREEYERFLKGEVLAFDEAIHAHCYECQGFYRDGTEDCKSAMCPLYRYMPYRAARSVKNMSESLSLQRPTLAL
jgi:hypothetical protein